MIGSVVLISFIVIVYLIYFLLIQKKNKVQEALSSIDVQLKKRYDLIPNILMIANKFMEHEKELLEEITALRTQAVNLQADINNTNKTIDLDKTINDKMHELNINIENYPDLKSNQTILNAMDAYNNQEEYIAATRRFYNTAVLDLNNAVTIFPNSIIAKILGIKKAQFFEITNDKETINTKFFFYKPKQ